MLRALVKEKWRTLVTDLRDSVDAEMMRYRADTPANQVTKRIAIVCVGAAIAMLVVRFAGRETEADWAADLLHKLGFEAQAKKLEWALEKSPDKRIYQRIWWASGRVLGYGIVPLLVTKLLLRDSIVDMGLRVKGTAKHVPLYLTMFCVVAPLVFLASYGDGFQAKYPYYRLAKGEGLWPNFILWELLYASQFIALEYCFRGFIINGLRQAFGYGAVFVPIIPYAMIHFGKPLPEAIGSIITGFVLGSMALKTRSIWGGAAIHISVACSMDFLSLWQQGRL
ncbi:MAG: CPBP family intramembrane metalloprotease [Myxococcales bacterium]|nr:CPBP family intramembrane metalloprotease [Myxococcales bacterium]